MAEETQPGTAQSVQPVNVMTAPAETQAPQQPTPTPPKPSGGGKTVEQLSAELEEQAQLVQQARDEAAHAQHEAQLARSIYENLTSGRVPEKEQAAEEYHDPSEEEYLTSPVKTTKRVVYGALEEFSKREREAREKEKTNQYLGTVRNSWEQGRQKATQSNPALFRGIADQVGTGILESVKNGLKTGDLIDPGLLSGEQYWELAAVAHRLSYGESMKSIISKYYSSAPTPMAPGHTETPTAGAPPQAALNLTEEDKAGARFFGVTDEQWAATKRAEGKK